MGAAQADWALCHLTVIEPSWCLKASDFVSSKCPCVIYGAGPFSTDLLPLVLSPVCSSTEISFKKANFYVLVKVMSIFETPGTNSALGLVSVPGEKSSFSIVYSCT